MPVDDVVAGFPRDGRWAGVRPDSDPWAVRGRPQRRGRRHAAAPPPVPTRQGCTDLDTEENQVRIRSRTLPVLAATTIAIAACGADTADTDVGTEDDAGTEAETEDLGDSSPDDTTNDGTVGGDDADDAGDDAASDDGATEDETAQDEATGDATDDTTAQDDDSAAASDAPVLTTASSELGDHLVDADGMTVYVNADGSLDEPACTGDCLGVWVPVEAPGEDAEVGDDVDADLVGVEQRDDGVLDDGFLQLTYDEQLLYTFVVDTEPGDLTGQEIDASWFVVGADGAPVNAAVAANGDDTDDA
jgi:predicted lipoprotein with Yx(FWY)xxD motif